MDSSFLDPYIRAIDAYFEGPLRRLIQSLGPPELSEPVLYSLLSGGKRIRPVLCLISSGYDPGENFDPFQLGPEEKRLFAHAAALECIHCYSLIHDDLPSMDDDDLRRGRPSSHRQFNEWAAILAGDALNTLSGAWRGAFWERSHSSWAVSCVSLKSSAGGARAASECLAWAPALHL